MNNWNAHKTNNEKGTDFREINVEGKISELIFTIKPASEYWRAGFKLLDPNGDTFPLRSNESLLFHLGSTPSNQEYAFTAYLNGEPIKELNKTKRYPDDKLLAIKLKINHNNFLEVYVNGSLEFKPKWHLKNPNIREKVVLVAWGDEQDYDVEFSRITSANWKGVRDKMQRRNIREKPSHILQITGNEKEPKTLSLRNPVIIAAIIGALAVIIAAIISLFG